MPYFIPHEPTPRAFWASGAPTQAGDEAFFNSLPEDAQQSLLAGVRRQRISRPGARGAPAQ